MSRYMFAASMYFAASSYCPLLNSLAPASRYLTGGAFSGGRAPAAVGGAASSGCAPSVAAPHAPRDKRIVSVLSLPNATSFRRDPDDRRLPWRRSLTCPGRGDMVPATSHATDPDGPDR